MSRITEFLGESVISSSDASGNKLCGTPIGAANVMIGVSCPELLPEASFLEASTDGIEWRRVQIYGMDAALPENRFVVFDGLPVKQLRAAASTPVTGDRVFKFWRILDI